jgi:hypothetical protein
MKRCGPIRRKRTRRVERKTAEEQAYTAWVHTRTCVGRRSFQGGMSGVGPHRCEGCIQQSHGRNLHGVTGLGLKPNDLDSIPMCAALHAQWEQRAGWFEGWSKEDRRAWFVERIAEENAAFQMGVDTRTELA